jgi:hypothetical protein
MNDLATGTLSDNIITTGDLSSCIQSITDRCSSIYYNPIGVPYDSCTCNNYTITTSAWPTKLETDSNELKINIKKFQIKFNFNL